MATTGDHNRTDGEPRRTKAATVTMVASAATGAAARAVPSGTSAMVSKRMGATVTAMSMTTVPETTGVNTRRSSESRAASKNWNSDETTISDAISDGPPASSAATQTAMNAPDVPIASTCPEPIRPSRTTCRMVATPLTTSAETTPQEMYESGCPAIRATMTTPRATGAMIVSAACSPTPAVTSAGGRSSGS